MGREKARLDPSRLLDRSWLGSRIKAKPRSFPGIYLGHHHLWCSHSDGRSGGARSSDGGKGEPVNHRSIVPAHGERPLSNKQPLVAIREMNGWYYHSNSVVNVAHSYIRDWFHEFLVHGTVWTGACDNAIHRSQRLKAKPLKSLDWPSDPLGPSWPSFPSIPEWMEMLRRGIDPFERSELNQPEGHLGFTQVSRREVSENPYLATRIVSNVIVGVRSSTEVPGKFLKFFRYSQNFLILESTWSLPIGLVRFLLGLWCQKPYSLWLRRSVTFKKFLKKVPISLVLRGRSRLADTGVRPVPTSASGFTSPTDYESDYESGHESELD